MYRGVIRAGLALMVGYGAGLAATTNAATAGVMLNQSYIDGVRAEQNFNIENLPETFAFVLSQLPDAVIVYPTENYFYFSFVHQGVEYAGNIRLDVSNRDDGIVHFAYFSKSQPWNSERITQYKPLNAEDGVTVEKLDTFRYRVAYGERSVEFQLNDLTGVTVPPGKIHQDEDYLGPVFDESGVEFYLLFDRELKEFRFILNEEGVKSEELEPYSLETPVILIGNRTGFAYFDDRRQDRRVLIGVYQGNVEANNYFDGPFDQLPDNFIPGDELKNAILSKYPELDGEIDRLGGFKDQDGRFLVNPYVNYYRLDQLDAFYRCMDPNLDRAAYYNCLTPGDDEDEDY